MGLRIVFFCFCMLMITSVKSKDLPQKFDKAAFYAAMSSNKLEEIDKALDIIASSSTPNKEGYEGALLMRKAGLVKRPAEKLKLFKAGRIKFDTAIAADTDNVEYHFLRLAIQEHAPKIVKYNKDIPADKKIILSGFKKQSDIVQNAIMNYAGTSKVMRADEILDNL